MGRGGGGTRARVVFPPGETVGGAASRLGCGEGALRAANPGLWGAGGAELEPGAALALPAGLRLAGGRGDGGVVVLRRGDLLVRIRGGDTLWGLQRRLGVPLEELRASNAGSEALRAGELLLVERGALLRRVEADAVGTAPLPRPRRFWKGFRVTSGVDEYRGRYRGLLAALRSVETGNALPAPAGDGGMSIGPLQIQSKYHEDAWQGREPYTRCEEVPHAEETAVRWWMTHVPWALEFGDLEAMARSHNGGPHFSKAHKTGRYWQKVRRELGSASAYRTGRMAPPGEHTTLMSADLVRLFRGGRMEGPSGTAAT